MKILNLAMAAGLLCVMLLTAETCGAESGQLTTLSIAAGGGHALALRSDGSVWSWGCNWWGEAGNGQFSSFPIRVPGISNVVSIAAGNTLSLAAQKDGSVWAWGWNMKGQIGIANTYSSVGAPLQVMGITNAVAVSCEGEVCDGNEVSHSMALLADGRIMTWGCNDKGQLGNGTTNFSPQPVFVVGLTNVIRCAAGLYNSVALTAAGEVWCWGAGTQGQLGREVASSWFPIKVPSLTNVVDIAAGSGHVLALRADGTIWTWGNNECGQLGLGHTNSVSVPTLVKGINHAKSISAGFYVSAACLSNGQILTWGQQTPGVNLTTTPAPLLPLAQSFKSPVFSKTSCGWYCSFGMTDDGAIWAWGVNNANHYNTGTFGDGTANYAFASAPTASFAAVPIARWGVFGRRGDLAWTGCYPVVLPVDFQQGVSLNPVGTDAYAYGAGAPWWFFHVASNPVYQPQPYYDGNGRLCFMSKAIENPIVAFGSQGGGSPLYLNEPYSFNVYGGGFDESTDLSTNAVRILVFDRNQFAGSTNVTPICTNYITLPRRTVAADSNAWNAFVINGSSATIETNGLRTTIQFLDGDTKSKPLGIRWMTNSAGAPLMIPKYILAGYKLTHTALSTNYFYKVEVLGKMQASPTKLVPMSTNASGEWVPTPLYTLDFDERPATRSVYVDRLFFEGKPLPPEYAGKTVLELNGLSAVVTNQFNLSNNPAYTNLNASPELRRHPILDQFVQDMGKDPLALASYVINEIELVDPYASAEVSDVVKAEINAGGVNRGALGVFLEGQGSPAEQCALLVYLLRQAGYPAAYVFPTNGNLSMLDTRISQLWQTQVRGVINDAVSGSRFADSLITVNYPWVVANIGTNTVHIFPWLKDTEIAEGVDAYDYMPEDYNTGLKWVRQYIRGNTNILSLDSENTPTALFPKFVKQMLATNAQGTPLSWDDCGVRAFNRRHEFPTWDSLPRPNYVTNLNSVAIVGSFSDSTKTFPCLANIFDLIALNVYYPTDAGDKVILSSGTWYACDWHNRKLLVFTKDSNLNLWMAPFSPEITKTAAFAAPSSTAIQLKSVSISGLPSTLKYRLVHQRRIARLTKPSAYYPIGELKDTQHFGKSSDGSFTLGDIVGIGVDFGRVTPAMVRMHSDNYHRVMESGNMNAPVQDSLGTVAYLICMKYFQESDSFDEVNQRFHKIRGLTSFMGGAGLLEPLSTTNLHPVVDIRIVQFDAFLANGTLHPDSGEDSYAALENYMAIEGTDGSAHEHNIMNVMFNDSKAVSTVRLLQLAQQRATNGNSPIIELTKKNFAALGNQSYAGYGTKRLKDQDPAIWSTLSYMNTNWFGDYTTGIITPGVVTNENGTYAGMGILYLGRWSGGAFLSGNKVTHNGGDGGSVNTAQSPPQTDDSVPQKPKIYQYPWGTYIYATDSNGRQQCIASGLPGQTVTWSDPRTGNIRSYDPLNQISTITDCTSGATYTRDWFNNTLTVRNASGAVIVYGVDPATGRIVWTDKNGNANVTDVTESSSSFGKPWIAKVCQWVYDPVDVISGNFYVDSVDITLPGPLPLQLRRNYLSQNNTANQLGNGWKQNFMSSLFLTNGANGDSIIYEADVDGSVIAFHQTDSTTNVWKVLPQDNPTLQNKGDSTGNAFNAYIQRFATNGDTYVVFAPDGSKRFYQQGTNCAMTIGTNNLGRVPPFLTRWQDHAGNYHLFSYGTNSAANDYNRLARIDSANGNSLIFKYDIWGRIIQAFTGDGRVVKYEYDKFNNLVTVTLPDLSQCHYEYAQREIVSTNITVTNTSVLTTNFCYLMTKEIKPNGRVVANTYDDLFRVTTQAATVGTNMALVTNAWFFYTNNAATQTNVLLSGCTRVEDVFHNPTVYYYTNGLIIKTVDSLGAATSQAWYSEAVTNVPGYYQRSLQQTVDKRGLTNQFFYNAFGCVTQAVSMGTNLLGDGTRASVTNIYTYTTNYLPCTITDPVGNTTRLFYTNDLDPFQLSYVINPSGDISSYFYKGVTNVLASPAKTNCAVGLRWREVLAGATNDYEYDGRGFVTRRTRYSATADYPANPNPAVIEEFIYTARGELFQQLTAGAGKTQMGYDPMGRITSREVFDSTGGRLSWEYYYYNRNGELEWYDGPRYDPEDYVWNHYDGAGHVIEQNRWRSQAKQDGTGVEAPGGYNLYSSTFSEFDAFGNLTQTVDSRGVTTSNTWDKLGRLVQQSVLEQGLLYKSEGFAYEAGGEVAFATNALGGVTETRYTDTGKPYYRRGPDGATNGWTYYPDGRVRREYLLNGAYAETIYNDLLRRVTKVFHSATGTALSTNIQEFDGRHNLVRRVDAGGFGFTNYFDGLDRVIGTAGPVMTGGVQQTSTNYFDAAGLLVTTVNGLGEKTITQADVLGRPTRTEVRDSGNVLVRENSTVYSQDHQSQTVTTGSGTSAVSSTVYTDNQGHPVLSIGYPGAGFQEFTLRDYDLVGNLVSESRKSSTIGKVTTWTLASYTYDGLNRVRSKSDRDQALTTFDYDSAGHLTNLALPGGLTNRAIYNGAMQKIADWEVGQGGIVTRSNSYSYYTNSAYSGLQFTRTDGRAGVCTSVYDDWLHLTSAVYSGAQPEQKLTTCWQYDVRGMATNITEAFASSATGPATQVVRSYDAYGQLNDERVVGEAASYADTLVRDAAGRRRSLSFGDVQYNYTWRADGLLATVSEGSGSGSYTYNTAGKLSTRTVGARATVISQRDGVGRPLSLSTSVNGVSVLSESLVYTGDGLLAEHTMHRSDFSDAHGYNYADMSRRLIEESLSLDAATRWTNRFDFDMGRVSGPGVLTKAGASGKSAQWSGLSDAFSRLAQTNGIPVRMANGPVNGQAVIGAWLDQKPVPVTVTGTGSAMRWQAPLDLTAGLHQLRVSATHPSGYVTVSVTNTFTFGGGSDWMINNYSANGELSSRQWISASGQTSRWQVLTWDAKGRLCFVTERDSQNSGFNWSAVYDPFGRRLRTTTTPVANGVIQTSQASSINQFFDPEVEFLELGESDNGGTNWKLYGPDLNGVYGGMNGTGGFEGVGTSSGVFTNVIGDARGNVLAEYTASGVSWYSSRVTGYGAAPGYRPLPLGGGANVQHASAWRGRWSDSTGYVWLGGNYYDPSSGQFLSFDPMGHASSPNGYQFCGGDPVNCFDPDGRLGKQVYDNASALVNDVLYVPRMALHYGVFYWLTEAGTGGPKHDVWENEKGNGYYMSRNGMNNTYSVAQWNAEHEFKYFKPEKLDLVYSPTAVDAFSDNTFLNLLLGNTPVGMFRDMLGAAAGGLLGIPNSADIMAEGILKERSEVYGDNMTILAHSRAAAETDALASLLSPELKSQINLVTYGGAGMFGSFGWESQTHHANVGLHAFDLTTLLGAGPGLFYPIYGLRYLVDSSFNISWNGSAPKGETFAYHNLPACYLQNGNSLPPPGWQPGPFHQQ